MLGRIGEGRLFVSRCQALCVAGIASIGTRATATPRGICFRSQPFGSSINGSIYRAGVLARLRGWMRPERPATVQKRRFFLDRKHDLAISHLSLNGQIKTASADAYVIWIIDVESREGAMKRLFSTMKTTHPNCPSTNVLLVLKLKLCTKILVITTLTNPSRDLSR